AASCVVYCFAPLAPCSRLLQTNKKKASRPFAMPWRWKEEIRMPEALFGELLRQFFRALLIGGLLCTAGQLLFDLANLTPAHTMSILVSTGSLLAICGIYPA